MNISFWTWEGPRSGRTKKRIEMFTDANPNVKVEVQSYTFQDLSKKVSVGFATGLRQTASSVRTGSCRSGWRRTCWRRWTCSGSAMANFKAFTATMPPRSSTAPPGTARSTALRYGFMACATTSHEAFKEVGLDPDKDWPQTWAQLGEVARKLTIKDGNKFTRQGFKWATHSAQWTMI